MRQARGLSVIIVLVVVNTSIVSASYVDSTLGVAESGTISVMKLQEEEEARKRKATEQSLANLREQNQLLKASQSKQLLINQQKIAELEARLEAQKLADQQAREAKLREGQAQGKNITPMTFSKKEEQETPITSYKEVLNTEEDLFSTRVRRWGMITTDMYISMLLETSLSTRSGGTAVLVVERDVVSKDFDPVTGEYNVVLPKGTRFVCRYNKLAKYGETSAGMDCFRGYFPTGEGIIINKGKGMPGYDQMGRIGVVGKLDNRLWEKYGNAFILSGIEGLAVYGASKIPDDGGLASVVETSSVGMMQTIQQTLKQSVNLAPIISIPAGTRVILRPTRDIRYESLEDLRAKMLQIKGEKERVYRRIDYRFHYGRKKIISKVHRPKMLIDYGRP